MSQTKRTVLIYVTPDSNVTPIYISYSLKTETKNSDVDQIGYET
jgi:hypothetical protein